MIVKNIAFLKESQSILSYCIGLLKLIILNFKRASYFGWWINERIAVCNYIHILILSNINKAVKSLASYRLIYQLMGLDEDCNFWSHKFKELLSIRCHGSIIVWLQCPIYALIAVFNLSNQFATICIHANI